MTYVLHRAFWTHHASCSGCLGRLMLCVYFTCAHALPVQEEIPRAERVLPQRLLPAIFSELLGP